MTTATQTWTEQMIEAAGANIQVVNGGSGDPLLILHDEMGHPGWMSFHESLSETFELTIPSHPGFGESQFLDWIMNMRDLAGWYLAALDDMGIGRVNLMGFSFGGWLAAEMATMHPDRFTKLVLVNPMGIKPPSGEIFDMFLVVAKEFLTESFLDPETTPEFQKICPEEPTPEQIEYWEVAREQACRLTWRPYMHYRGLPHLLSETEESSDTDHLGQAEPDRSVERRARLSRVDPRLRPRRNRQLRPPAGDRAPGRVRPAGQRLPGGLTGHSASTSTRTTKSRTRSRSVSIWNCSINPW